MPKLIQVKEHEILIALSFWALGHPITCMIGFIMSGIKATGDDEKLVSLSTAMVDGLTYGPANILLFGVTLVLNLMGYVYIRYALRLQLKEIPSTFTWLFFLSYSGLGLLLVCPQIELHMSPFDYGIQYIGSQIFMVFAIAWMGYFSQWLKSVEGRTFFRIVLLIAAGLVVTAWGLAGAVSEKSSASAEWSSLGIIMACHAIVVFTCERDRYMKLNSNGFGNQVSQTPQEYE